jgi:hypothetical protein
VAYRARETFSIEREGGLLNLAPRAGAQANPWTDEYADAVVARRTVSGDYVATTLVVTRSHDAHERARGSRHTPGAGGSVGIAAGGGRVTVWRREGDNMKRNLRIMAEATAQNSDVLYLRMTAEGRRALPLRL